MTAGIRILTDDEYELALRRLTDAAYQHGSRLTGASAHDALTAALAAVGVFAPPPAPEPDLCTARFVPTDPEAFSADALGEWQQCGEDPGHEGDGHDNGEFAWNDGDTGALPATDAEA